MLAGCTKTILWKLFFHCLFANLICTEYFVVSIFAMYHHITMLFSSIEASWNLFYLLANNYIPLLIQPIYLTGDFLGRGEGKEQVKAALLCLSYSRQLQVIKLLATSSLWQEHCTPKAQLNLSQQCLPPISPSLVSWLRSISSFRAPFLHTQTQILSSTALLPLASRSLFSGYMVLIINKKSENFYFELHRFYILPCHNLPSYLRSMIRSQVLSKFFEQMSHSPQTKKKNLHLGRKKESLCSLPQTFLPKWNLGLQSKIKDNVIARK